MAVALPVSSDSDLIVFKIVGSVLAIGALIFLYIYSERMFKQLTKENMKFFTELEDERRMRYRSDKDNRELTRENGQLLRTLQAYKSKFGPLPDPPKPNKSKLSKLKKLRALSKKSDNPHEARLAAELADKIENKNR